MQFHPHDLQKTKKTKKNFRFFFLFISGDHADGIADDDGDDANAYLLFCDNRKHI